MGRGPLHRYIKLKLIAPGEDILEIKSRSEDTAIQKGTVNDKGEILVGNKKFNSIGKFVQLVYCTKTSKKVFYKDQSLHEIKNVLSNGSLIQRDIASTPPPFYHDFVEQIQECINLRFNFDLRGMTGNELKFVVKDEVAYYLLAQSLITPTLTSKPRRYPEGDHICETYKITAREALQNIFPSVVCERYYEQNEEGDYVEAAMPQLKTIHDIDVEAVISREQKKTRSMIIQLNNKTGFVLEYWPSLFPISRSEELYLRFKYSKLQDGDSEL